MSRSLVLAFAGLLLLSGCGIPGSLSRPGPMWNKQGAEAADARRHAELCAQPHQTNAQRRECAHDANATTSSSTTTTPSSEPSQNTPPGSATSQQSPNPQ